MSAAEPNAEPNEGVNGNGWRRFFRNKPELFEEAKKGNLIYVTAQDIKDFAVREPRLMAKIDHRENLPPVFAENQLSILPTKRGEYVIGKFEMFADFEHDDTDPEEFPLPDFITSITPESITSEAVALSAAFSAGIIQDFVDDPEILPTINGRGGSGEFDFVINRHAGSTTPTPYEISVTGAQVEIDAGYEGLSGLFLIEAKLNLFENFVIRQLYYPFRTWEQKTEKTVKTIFLTYSNGIFSLAMYEWHDKGNYSAGVLTKTKNYTLLSLNISEQELEQAIQETSVITKIATGAPFPQADAFWRVINLCELLNKEPTRAIELEEISATYDFVSRQAQYYSRAAMFLGLVETSRSGIKLTEIGAMIFSQPIRQRQLELAKLVMAHAPFRRTADEYKRIGARPDRGYVAQLVADYSGVNPTTADRRAGTVFAWVEWVLSIPVSNE